VSWRSGSDMSACSEERRGKSLPYTGIRNCWQRNGLKPAGGVVRILRILRGLRSGLGLSFAFCRREELSAHSRSRGTGGSRRAMPHGDCGRPPLQGRMDRPMPRRISEIELGLCFLIMFGTATIADDEVIFDLSEASIQQVAGRRRSLRAERYVETAPYPMSPQQLSPLHAPHSPVSVQPGYPRSDGSQPDYPQSRYPEPGSPQSAPPHWGPSSGDLPPGSPQSAYPHSGNAPSGYPQSGYPQSGYPQSGYPQSGYPQSGYPQPESPPPGHPYHSGSTDPYSPPPQSGYPQSEAAEFAYPGGEYSQFVHPEPGSAAFGPVPAEEPGGLFSWRPRAPHFDLPSRSYSLFRSPASYGWSYRERCAATPWKPRGNGIPRRTSCFRMDYDPYELEHDSSKHGPAFYRRHELYPCAECHLHGYHLKRFYKHHY
jgi:hypothetical protein